MLVPVVKLWVPIVSTKKPVVGFKTTTSGHYIGYCATCNDSSFYKEFNLRGDSVCCGSEILPERKEWKY